MNMKRSIYVFVAGAAVATTAIYASLQERQATAAVQAGGTSVRQLPKFEVDPSWPKIPNGWVLGEVSSAAADQQGHIWVLHRPRTVRVGQKTGPPVLEFDAAGNYIQGWGGAAAGYDWPESEHGIYVDSKGYVWIGGQGDDDQILKFTNTGKFVLQIGQRGQQKSNKNTKNFWRPADIFVYAKTNELFVADGYGNRRVIVFDADSGAYKRMWGAFGNVPSDDRVLTSSEAMAAAVAAAEDPARIPAKALSPTDPGPPQFNTLHGIKVSNDGYVYAADRGGKRVQVFRTDGTFVAQAFIDRYCEAPHCGNGHTAGSVAFSGDPEQQFLFVSSRSPARIWVLDRKTLELLDSFGRPGVAPGEFYVIHHMTSDSAGNVYVSEVQDGRRVQKFAFKGVSPRVAK